MRIDVYAWGSGYRVRVHEHDGGADDRCCDACTDDHVERAYPDLRVNPFEQRVQVESAIARALRAYGHAEFMRMLRDQQPLW